MKPNAQRTFLKLFVLGIILLFTNKIYAQSDTLFIEFNNDTYAGYEITSSTELTFSSEATDSIYIKETNLQKTGHRLSELKEISFNNGNSGGASLPVELTDFSGQLINSKVVLNWKTVTESGNYGFDIEKRMDNVWRKIAFVAGKGTTREVQSYHFDDNNIESVNFYRLKQLDINGKFSYSQILTIGNKPDEFSLKQNYPNPFNPTTQIAYSLTQKGEVSLKVVDMTGKVIKELFKGVQESGDHLQTWNGNNSNGRMSSSGVYMILIEFNGTQLSKKMTLIK